MKIVFSRYMIGNRGDIASRWGILSFFHELGVEDATVFTDSTDDLPPTGFKSIPYGRLWNFFPPIEGLRALRAGDVALWSVGHDLQDDSSLAKLIYVLTTFLIYKLLGLSIWVLCQGAGPLETSPGRFLTSLILKLVDVFVARDPGTFALVKSISPKTRYILGYDAIFFPHLEAGISSLGCVQKNHIDALFESADRPVIGINIRQWFHFASSLLPYEITQKKYEDRSQDEMKKLIHSFIELIRSLRNMRQAKFLLVSAYKPDIVPWEDDLPWLGMIKHAFLDDVDVKVVDSPLTVPEYFYLMSRLDLMIGMRLHSVLISLRFGVPSINISYTLKGTDIMTHLELDEYVLPLVDFMQSPDTVISMAEKILDNPQVVRKQIQEKVSKAIHNNGEIFKQLISGCRVG